MLRINLSKRAAKFPQRLPAKQQRQIAAKILALADDPAPPDSAALRGHPYRRADVGEYRIIYEVVGGELRILLIGRRNDAAIYKELRRLG
jgi:mRNA interferase RelE/StbE